MSPDALILCGGLGTRLRTVVADRPKALASIGEAPFLTLQVQYLMRYGIRRCILCTGHMSDQIEQWHPPDGCEVVISKETEPLGTGGAVAHALSHVKSDPFLVLNGDSFCDVALDAFMTCPAPAIVVVRVEDSSRFGRVVFDNNRDIQSFEEKTNSQGAGWINAGIYSFARAHFDAAPTRFSLERELFPRLIGHGLQAYRAEGAAFIDIGTPESYARAESVIQGHLRNSSNC
ncbi:MAG: sugar phosphate nucleotidyltransferase [Candidatus Xenobia bacterium]